MKISITLHKSKELSNGEHPILIRVFQDGKYYTASTGVSTKEKYWNIKSYTVSSKDRDYKQKNNIISEKYNIIKNRVEQCLKIYGNLNWGLVKSDRDISIEEEDNNINSFSELVEAKIRISNAYGYQKNFIQLKKFVLSNLEDIPLRGLNQDFYNRFLESISNKTDAMKTKLMRHFIILCNFAYENGYIRKRIKNKRITYNSDLNEKCLTHTEFSGILSFYKKEVQSGAYNGNDFHDYDYSLGIFILMIAFQGIAPIDIAKLKIKDIKIEILDTINFDVEDSLNDPEYENYYRNNNEQIKVASLTYFRTKTGIKVDICTDYFSIEPIIDYFTKGKNKNDYLINCLDARKEYTDKQIQSRVSNWFTEQVKILNKALEERSKNKENKFPPIKHFTYYSARHTFINALNNMNISHNMIRKLIGHKDNTLEKNYISKATKIEQARLITIIFSKYERIYELYREREITD